MRSLNCEQLFFLELIELLQIEQSGRSILMRPKINVLVLRASIADMHISII